MCLAPVGSAQGKMKHDVYNGTFQIYSLQVRHSCVFDSWQWPPESRAVRPKARGMRRGPGRAAPGRKSYRARCRAVPSPGRTGPGRAGSGPGRRLPHMVARPGHRRRAFLGISPDLLISGIRSDAPATPIQTAPTQSSRSQLPRYCPHIFHVHCAQYIPKVAFYTTNPIPFMAKPCGVRPNCTQLELREHNMEL